MSNTRYAGRADGSPLRFCNRIAPKTSCNALRLVPISAPVVQGVEEAVMESTAQYWRSVWIELEPHMRPTKLRLVSHHLYRSGRMSLAYEVQR